MGSSVLVEGDVGQLSRSAISAILRGANTELGFEATVECYSLE